MMRHVQAVKLLHHLRETCKFAVSYRANAETREFTVVCDDRCNAQIMTEQNDSEVDGAVAASFDREVETCGFVAGVIPMMPSPFRS